MSILAPELRSQFLALAQTKGLAFLDEQPLFKPRSDKLAYVVVGSVATGLCTPTSDIDIAVVSDQAVYEELTRDPAWAATLGSPESRQALTGDRPPGGDWPAQTVVDGVRLQYYCTTYEWIEAGIADLRDSYIYHYGTAVILRDPQQRYARLLESLRAAAPALRKQRLEGKLDWLRRRYGTLEASLRYRDVIGAVRVGLELIILAVKVTALLDDVPFDPRKRLLLTGLAGRLCYQLEGSFRQLLAALGELGRLDAGTNLTELRLPGRLVGIINILSDEARAQGFTVDLERPDPRCAESQVSSLGG